MRSYLIVVGVLLVGCSETYSVRPDLAGDAPTTEVVIESLPKIFSASVKPTNFAITQPRPWGEGALKGWLVCVRATVTKMGTNRIGPETLAVFFQRREISLRERAEPKHGCNNFERIVSSQSNSNE
jgi:hypothetical protein